ncbi:MAG: Sec-independent protein translocase protein TatB [Candidatus Nanopelagicales bacterium]
MFDIGFGEFLLLGIVGLVILGPDKLPQYAAQAARFIRQLRSQVSEARSSIVEAAAIDKDTLKDLKDLDPRRILDENPATTPRSSSVIDPDTT